MGNHRVTSHRHHPAEGVYRLTYAEKITHEDNTVSFHGHVDVVWADDDERWQDRSSEDIAQEQRHIVSVALAQAEPEQEAEMTVPHTDMGGAGSVL